MNNKIYKIIFVTRILVIISVFTIFIVAINLPQNSEHEEVEQSSTEEALSLEDYTLVQRFYIDMTVYYVNDVEKQMDTTPIIKDGRTFLPIRYVAENIGAHVEWHPEDKNIIISLHEKTVRLWVDTTIAYVNDELSEVDVAPFILEGRTFIPVRFVGEKLGLNIQWDSDKKELMLLYKG
ncbi:UNVERIFIED_CONTAM: copper amine oxidase-like protein [Acetivibrio alkalicellulosi]